MEAERCIAVVGTGSIGMRHLRALESITGVRAVGIPQRKERLAVLHESGHVTAADLNEAADRYNARLAIIATDTGRHLTDALSVLDRYLDVLVEKPLCANLEEARLLRERAEMAKRKVFVGCVLRFSDSLAEFRQLLPKIGRVHTVRIECQSYLPDWRPDRPYEESYSASAEQGGVLRDLIHEIDYAGWIFGWPTALQARLDNLGRLGIKAEEAADLLWETRDGCMVSIRLDYLTKPTRRRMHAFGEGGTLEWDAVENIVSLSGNLPVKVTFTQTRDDMMVAQAWAFLESANGLPDPRLGSVEDGVHAVAICDAARYASASGRKQEVAHS